MVTPPPERILPERPTLDFEGPFWRSGFSGVAGVDEVGRGALAGPLVAAAVVLPVSLGAAGTRLRKALAGVRDSKLMTAAQRVEMAKRIRDSAVGWSVDAVTADELDRVGVTAANRIAMERAVAGLANPVAALLLDARVIEADVPQVGLIKGDRRSLSVACAAILAKVHRDALMVAHHERDGRYAFAAHKGYGTPDHLSALTRHGPCDLHRRSFQWPGNETFAVPDGLAAKE